VRNLNQHSGVRTGDPGHAEQGDGSAREKHVQVVERDRNLAQLAVFPACDKKDVETFTQNFLPLVISGGAISERLAICEVPDTSFAEFSTRSRVGDDAIRVRAYQDLAKAPQTYRLQSLRDTELSSAKGA
jgi:hypothetical protein